MIGRECNILNKYIRNKCKQLKMNDSRELSRDTKQWNTDIEDMHKKAKKNSIIRNILLDIDMLSRKKLPWELSRYIHMNVEEVLRRQMETAS